MGVGTGAAEACVGVRGAATPREGEVEGGRSPPASLEAGGVRGWGGFHDRLPRERVRVRSGLGVLHVLHEVLEAQLKSPQVALGQHHDSGMVGGALPWCAASNAPARTRAGPRRRPARKSARAATRRRLARRCQGGDHGCLPVVNGGDPKKGEAWGRGHKQIANQRASRLDPIAMMVMMMMAMMMVAVIVKIRTLSVSIV